VRVDMQLRGGRPGCARKALQAQHFLASARPQRNRGTRGGLQRSQCANGIRFGEVGLVWFFDDSARSVNKRMMRVMILVRRASSSSTVGAADE
jgi:hypothetical protein